MLECKISLIKFMVEGIIQLTVNGISIEQSKTIKLLGVTIDKDLMFSEHVDNISKQASKQINAMSRLSRYLNLSCKTKILDAFIMSNFNYCSISYHHCKIKDARRLENLLKLALRFVYLDFESSYNELLRKAQRNSLYVNRQKTMLLGVFKILHDMYPPIKCDFFTPHNTAYSLRRSHVLEQPSFRTMRHGYHSLRYQGAMLWNSLPDFIKTSDFNTFRGFILKWQPICQCGSCILCTI